MTHKGMLDGLSMATGIHSQQNSICYYTFDTEAELRAFLVKYAQFKIYD